MKQSMHKTTIMIPEDQRDYMEQWCFEHGIAFAAWVRQQIARQRRDEQERQLRENGYSHIRIPGQHKKTGV